MFEVGDEKQREKMIRSIGAQHFRDSIKPDRDDTLRTRVGGNHISLVVKARTSSRNVNVVFHFRE